ncbi:hypothetical protein [Lachnoclostridium sp. MSJ-17]|uniref:hypothetical protein n=1 Tax=Lachnoclostridium sp. MSJ-17 TaxID=2841516 RepID=UPI001C10B719|nr:hypothetical protein [Lachnoclostridium sp. MSJ-17]MBU5461363.1 hypothetical protein [Lachnoclostridium sp. MSJ-17]
MKKVIIVCIIALVAAFSVTGCASSGALNESSQSQSTTKDCCKDKESTDSEVPDCCKNKEHTDNNSSKTSDVPDCCAGE